MTRGRARVQAAMLVLGSGLFALLLAEAALRWTDYQFSPLLLVARGEARDFRAFHSARDPRTVFDPHLFWRLSPRASAYVDRGGNRGGIGQRRRETTILAVGDSNTMGSLESGHSWPAHVQTLADLNAPGRFRVVNAGCMGYSSLQGLRRFQELLPQAPKVAYFSFGANDGHPALRTDAEYAASLGTWQRFSTFRLAGPILHGYLAVSQRVTRDEARTVRVPLPEFEANLDAFVRMSRAADVIPILLTRPFLGSSSDPAYWKSSAPAYNEATRRVAARMGVECVDIHGMFRNRKELFADESHFNRAGHQLMAGVLVRDLRRLNVLPSDVMFRSAVDLGEAEDDWPELGDGWWKREAWGPGRWTTGTAVLRLERRRQEAGLELDLVLQHPSEHNHIRVEVNRKLVGTISTPNASLTPLLDISAVKDRWLEVRIAVSETFRPSDQDPADPDQRVLGVFVRSVRLTNGSTPSRRGH